MNGNNAPLPGFLSDQNLLMTLKLLTSFDDFILKHFMGTLDMDPCINYYAYSAGELAGLSG